MIAIVNYKQYICIFGLHVGLTLRDIVKYGFTRR